MINIKWNVDILGHGAVMMPDKVLALDEYLVEDLAHSYLKVGSENRIVDIISDWVQEKMYEVVESYITNIPEIMKVVEAKAAELKKSGE